MICKYFLPFCDLSFHPLHSTFQRTEVLSFNEDQSFYFLFGIAPNKFLPNSLHKGFLPAFPEAIVLHATFWFYFCVWVTVESLTEEFDRGCVTVASHMPRMGLDWPRFEQHPRAEESLRLCSDSGLHVATGGQGHV